MYTAQVNHVNCVNPNMSQTPLIPQYQLPALAPALPVLYIIYRIPYFHSPAGYHPSTSCLSPIIHVQFMRKINQKLQRICWNSVLFVIHIKSLSAKMLQHTGLCIISLT